jgi:gamma-glutamyltranspeptidase/glutathione hydrolase
MNRSPIRIIAITAAIVAAACLPLAPSLGALAAPVRAQKGMVASQNEIASRIGAKVITDGGNAVDAAVATAFALAVTHPTAGNIGGGGFIVFRPAAGEPVTYDFREKAPAKASPTMWLKDGQYSAELHHNSYLAV